MYPFKVINKKKYALCLLSAFIENLCIYLIPVVLSIYLTAPFTLEKFMMLIILTVGLKTLEIILNFVWNMKISVFLQHTKKDLLMAYFKRICNVGVSTINNTHTGYLKKQLDIVTDETVLLLNEILMSVNGFIIAITIFLIQVYKQNVVVFFICLIFIILIVIYNVFISKANVKYQKEYNDKDSKYNATAVDFLQNIKVVKNFDAANYAVDTIDKRFNDVKNPLKKTRKFVSLRWDGIHALVYIMYTIVLISLFMEMKNGANVFSYVVFYTTMFSGLNTELRGIATLFLHINKFKSANDQVEEMIIEEKEQGKIKNWRTIVLKDISFKYNGEANIPIKIPYFKINRGDKVSIVGESGQGKSTFLSLFSRFYFLDKNSYIVDDKPTDKKVDIAYISQETDLFDLTIKENLCLGKDISDRNLNEYLKDAGLLEWVNNLEKGLDTLVGEKGIKLSAGQKQRLNIIRGILLDKEIYILDEPTSNLDRVSENKIYDMIDKYLRDKTCIIVTHRDKLTEICNKHYYFKDKTMLEK